MLYLLGEWVCDIKEMVLSLYLGDYGLVLLFIVILVSLFFFFRFVSFFSKMRRLDQIWEGKQVGFLGEFQLIDSSCLDRYVEGSVEKERWDLLVMFVAGFVRRVVVVGYVFSEYGQIKD